MAACPRCQKTFSSVSTLNRHVRNVHGEKNKFETSKLICPSEDCIQQFNRYNGLREHLKKAHGVYNSCEEFVFESEEDFELWRYQIQNESSSEYVKGTSTKVQADGCKKTYLYCNRSYKYRPKRKGDGLRKMKSMGSRKMGKACPSTIEVTKRLSGNGVIIEVMFWKDHFGHTCNLEHTTIPDRDRDEIARKLKSGVTIDGVLEAVRRPLTDDADEEFPWSKRTSLMERKDLHNVVQQYNIAYSTKRHKDDGFTRDCMFKRLIKLNKNMSSEKTQKVNKSHRASVNVKDIKTVKENEWLSVSSSSDFLEDFPTSHQDEATQCEVETFQLTRSEGHLFSAKERLKEKLKLALNLLENAPENVINKKSSVEKNLDLILSDLNKIPDRTRIKNNVHTTKKIDQQVRLFSTKKKGRPNSFYKKPLANKYKNIVYGLKNPSNEPINVHTEFDHSYC